MAAMCYSHCCVLSDFMVYFVLWVQCFVARKEFLWRHEVDEMFQLLRATS